MRKSPIVSLGLITSTTTAAKLTAADTSVSAATAHGDQVAVIKFQWVSGTVYIGDSTVATSGVGAYLVLDTTSRLQELRTPDGSNALPVSDIWCVGSGTFICCYQVH